MIQALHNPWNKRVPERSAGTRRSEIRAFEDLISRDRDLLYGMALFFEGLAVLYIEQEQIIQTYRRQFRNLIQNSQEKLDRAGELIDRVRRGDAPVQDLRRFNINLAEGYPDPEELLRRAEILVQTYEEIFPERDRSTPFSKEETLRLVEAAVQQL